MYVTEEMGSIPPQEIEPDEVATPPASQTHIAQRPEVPQEDIQWMRNATAMLATRGYDEAEVKSYLWKTYQTVGINAARVWVESQIDAQSDSEPISGPESVPVGVDAETGELGPNFAPEPPDDIEIADEDIPFPED
jgi:hypothetical protein